MERRFVSVWFRHLHTDWFTQRQSDFVPVSEGKTPLQNLPFVLKASSHGRMVITSANAVAEMNGISVGMVLADARAVVPDLVALDDKPGLSLKLLTQIAHWCILFTPVVAIDPPDGLLLDVTGCPHLWGGDEAYLETLVRRLRKLGYDVRAALAGTAGVAWGVARYGKDQMVVPPSTHVEALMGLPPEALRIEQEMTGRLHKLGLHLIRQFINIPRSSLRRRFGPAFISRLAMARGEEMEILDPILPVEPYEERLPCLDPISTAAGIEIALRQLLETLCFRLQQDQKGIRSASFKGYRVDGKVEKIEIGTHRPSHHASHLFKLFELKIQSIEPALGIELFVLDASKVEDHFPQQEKMWQGSEGLEDIRLAELLDRLSSKIGSGSIRRFLPDEHYWPERSFRMANSIDEKPSINWREDKLRPLQLLSRPEPIQVTAPIPDYPPMLFRHHDKLHKIVAADGPERIEQEWWLQQGQHRDYYRVEDEEGQRYWLFRLGHYEDKRYHWFIHGYFA